MALFLQRIKLLKKALSQMTYLEENLYSSVRYNIIKQQLTQRLAVESIFSQTLKPNNVVLYLSEKEFSTRPLPLTLMRQQERGLEVRFVDDLGPHTKLIPALKDFPEAIIVTIDDDYMYPFDLLERYRAAMDGVFGKNATTVLAIRPEGVVCF